MTFADQLKAERARTGLSQEGAAVVMGVRLRTVQRWENGERLPKHPAMIEGALARLRAMADKAGGFAMAVNNQTTVK